MYKWKVYGTLVLGPLFVTIIFFIAFTFYGLMWAIGGLAVGVAISVLISKLMINNPFSLMLEGKGVLCQNIDSTGILRPFIVAVQSPFIKNKKLGVTDVFDREAVFQYAIPANNRTPLEMLENGGVKLTIDKKAMLQCKEAKEFYEVTLDPGTYRLIDTNPKKGVRRLELRGEAIEKVRKATKDNLLVIELSEKEYNSGRFALYHYPALIYNDQLKSIITKDFLAGQEKEAFAEHNALYLNRVMEQLTNAVRDFGRHVVELTRPSGGLMSKWWVWVIIVVFVGILLAMFAGPVITAIKGASGGAMESFSSAASGSVTPR